jgi:hypothetical protein
MGALKFPQLCKYRQGTGLDLLPRVPKHRTTSSYEIYRQGPSVLYIRVEILTTGREKKEAVAVFFLQGECTHD